MTASKWTKTYQNHTLSYPPEYIIRIFKGSYPELKWDKNFINKKICDISAGDGRNLPLFHQLGFKIYATEINQDIVNIMENNIQHYGIDPVIKVGNNENIPFPTNFFDYTVAWNCSYYIDKKINNGGGNVDMVAIPPAVKEYARITKVDTGYLILSIPKKTCFIYKNAEPYSYNIVKIKDDPFLIRNNTYMYIYQDEKHIIDTFSEYFNNIASADIHDNCFGYDYHWHILIMQRNNKNV